MVTSLYNSQASKQATFHLNDGIAAIPTPAMVAIMPLYYNVQRSNLLGARLARLQTRTIDARTGVLGCACLGTCVFRLTSLLACARARIV